MTPLKELINNKLGGVSNVARVCKKSPRAIYKWCSSGKLPRTEFTGETNYCELLEKDTGISRQEIFECGTKAYSKAG